MSGFYVIKLIQTNKNGIPDLLCLKDGYKNLFIEVKQAGGRVAELQTYRIKELRAAGQHCLIFLPNGITGRKIHKGTNKASMPTGGKGRI